MRLWKVLSLIGIVLLVAAILFLKSGSAPAETQTIDATGLLPEQAFAQAKAAELPILALFHSTTCIPCMEMERIVGEVRPDFEGQVTFIDVNVYDPQNTELCRSARIRVIPTTVLVDASGESRTFQGVVQPDQLREELSTIAGSTSNHSG